MLVVVDPSHHDALAPLLDAVLMGFCQQLFHSNWFTNWTSPSNHVISLEALLFQHSTEEVTYTR